jgi:hypothetical protein
MTKIKTKHYILFFFFTHNLGGGGGGHGGWNGGAGGMPTPEDTKPSRLRFADLNPT